MTDYTALSITMNLELDPWQDLAGKVAEHGSLTRIGLLPQGTSGGKASIAMVVTLDDGRVAVVETTWALMRNAVRALAASPVAEMEGL